MQETDWCARCQDQPVRIGQILCSYCHSQIPKILLIPDKRTYVCRECDHIIGYHSTHCKEGRPKSRTRVKIVIVVGLVILFIFLAFG